jgi:hypothetical protein
MPSKLPHFSSRSRRSTVFCSHFNISRRIQFNFFFEGFSDSLFVHSNAAFHKFSISLSQQQIFKKALKTESISKKTQFIHSIKENTHEIHPFFHCFRFCKIFTTNWCSALELARMTAGFGDRQRRKLGANTIATFAAPICRKTTYQ